jgi:hypothetical protein
VTIDAAVAHVEHASLDGGSLARGIVGGSAVATAGRPARRWAIRSVTCVLEMTAPQTGMYGWVGLLDSPSP